MVNYSGEQQEEAISRAEFARRLDVAKSMIGRYVRRGCPSLPNGRIPWPSGELWVHRNIVPERSGNYVRRRLAKAERVAIETAKKAQRALMDHLIAQTVLLPEVIAEIGVTDGALLAGASDIAISFLFFLAVPHEFYDFSHGDDYTPPKPDLLRLKALFAIDGDPADWEKGADEIIDKLDGVLQARMP